MASRKRRTAGKARQAIVPPVRAALRPNAKGSQRKPECPRPAGQDEALSLRRQQAFQLRIKGNSYRAIAAALHVDVATAYADVTAEMAYLRETTLELAEQVREQSLARMDAAVKGLEPDVALGDPRAVAALIAVESRRAKLLGLDQPDQIRVSVDRYRAMDDAELQVEIARLQGEVGQ
jgi:hypothetical protein